MQTLALTRKDLEEFAVCRIGLRRPDLWRMSTSFLAQLLKKQVHRDLDSFGMLNEIDLLESGSWAADKHGGVKKKDRPWIVYREYNGVKYYLTLAELNEGDQNIHRRINDACEFDFPFLQESTG